MFGENQLNDDREYSSSLKAPMIDSQMCVDHTTNVIASAPEFALLEISSALTSARYVATLTVLAEQRY